MDKRRRLVTLGMATGAVGLSTGLGQLAYAKARTGPGPIGGGPIRILVPYAAGSAQELVVRTFSGELASALGDPVVIEERPGGGGGLASELVSQAKPNGHTMVIAAETHLIAPLMRKVPPYNPIKDFTPIAEVGISGGHVITVSENFPAKTFAEFIKYVKAHPGKVTYSSAGVGTITQLAMAMVAGAAGLEMVNIPFNSNSGPILGVMSGRIDATAIPMSLAPRYIKNKKLRMLAVTSAHRSPLLPNLPAVSETYPGYSFQGWYGLLAPAGVPKPIVDELNTTVNKLLGEPVVRERLARLSITVHRATPEEFKKTMEEDYVKIRGVLQKAGVLGTK